MARMLYSGTRNASSWAFRAWLALKEAHIEFQEHVVDIRVPQRYENLARVGTFSPPAAVPVLVDDDGVIFDSLAIMEYANDLSGSRLLPRDPKARAVARSWLAWQHAGLSGLCARLSFESAFYPDKRPMSAEENTDAARVFRALEATLARHEGPWVSGDLSLADLALVPTVVRIGAHAPDLHEFPRVADWMRNLLERPAVQEWMQEAHALPPVRLAGYLPE